MKVDILEFKLKIQSGNLKPPPKVKTMNKKPRNSIREGVINKTVLEMSILNIFFVIISLQLAIMLIFNEVRKIQGTISNTAMVPIVGLLLILLFLLVFPRIVKKKYEFDSSLLEIVCAIIIVAKMAVMMIHELIVALQPIFAMVKVPAIISILLLVTIGFGALSMLLKLADHFAEKFDGSNGIKADTEHVYEANKFLAKTHDNVNSYLKKKLGRDSSCKNKQLH